jgi:hypothetical protein
VARGVSSALNGRTFVVSTILYGCRHSTLSIPVGYSGRGVAYIGHVESGIPDTPLAFCPPTLSLFRCGLERSVESETKDRAQYRSRI